MSDCPNPLANGNLLEKRLVAIVALFLALVEVVHANLPIDSRFVFTRTNYINIDWIANPGAVYVLNSTTNLSQPWQQTKYTTTSKTLSVSIPMTGVAQFFQIVRLDTQGPRIYQTLPMNYAIGVSQQAVLRAWLWDETGINSNSIVLNIGTNPPVTLSDPRLTWSTNDVLTYTPGSNEILGALGQTITVSLSAADTLGNITTNFSWSFQLAIPAVLSSDIVFIGSGTNAPANLVLLFTNGNTFTYSYIGNSSGLSEGMQLIDTNQINGYTVTVVSFSEQPTNNTVAVVTRPTLLAELLQQGTLVSGNFTEVADGLFKPLFMLPGIQLNYTYPLDEVIYQDDNLEIDTLPGSAVSLNAELNIAANFQGSTLTSFQATLAGTANFQLDFQAVAQGAESSSGEVALIGPFSRTFFGFVEGVPVPVWLTVKFEVDAGFDASLDAQGVFTTGVNASGQVLFGQTWNQTTGWTTIAQNSGGLSFQQPVWQIEGSAGLTVYLKPVVTLTVNGLAGVTGDLKSYAKVIYTFQLDPEECDLSLFAGLNSDFALNLTAWDSNWGQLPSATFNLIPQTLLYNTNCADMAPQIISEPVDQSVQEGEPALFEVEAQGTEPITYQWLLNGLPLTDQNGISGSTTPTLTLDDVQSCEAGNYTVRVRNDYGSTNSTPAVLTVETWSGTWAGTYEYDHESDQYDPPCENDCLFISGGNITIQLTVSGGYASGLVNMDGITTLDCCCDFLGFSTVSGPVTGTVFADTLGAEVNGTGYYFDGGTQPFPISFVATLDASGNTMTAILSREGSATFEGEVTLNRQSANSVAALKTLSNIKHTSSAASLVNVGF